MIRKIAVWNTAFLGDAVLTLPLIQALADAFPEAALDFYVRKGLGPLFAAHPAVHTVHEYNRHPKPGADVFTSLWEMGRCLASNRYDLWVGAHPSPRSALLARLSRADIRIGYCSNPVAVFCYTHRIARRFDGQHEIERLIDLVRPVLPEDFLLDREQYHWPRLVLPESARRAAENFRTRLSGDGPLLGLHPGSQWGTKRWTVAGFAEIARRGAESGAHICVFAGPGEESMAREVILQAGLAGNPSVHDLSGALSLPELAAYIGLLGCYVSNDSGPMHLAWVQRTPVTALFGPTVRSLGFFPRGEGAKVFEVPLPCRPCGLHGPQICPLGHHRCMTEIDVNAVWEDVASKLFSQVSPIRVGRCADFFLE